MYEIQKGRPFYTTLKYLRMMRQIPKSTGKGYLRMFLSVFLMSKFGGFFFTTIGPLLHLIVSIMNNSQSNIAEDISIALGATGAGVVCLLFTIKYKEWSTFFKDVADTTPFGKPAIFDVTVHRLNRYGNICFFCASWVYIVYAAAALYSADGCSGRQDQICPTLLPLWLPFGTNNFKVGAFIFFLQMFFAGILIAQVFFAQCYIIYESTEILICHITQLKKDLKEAVESQSLSVIRDKLRFCINYHVHILHMGYRLNTLIKYTAGHMSLLSAIVCGCIANQMLSIKPIGSLFYLAGWLFSLLCFCHAGQRIKDETLSVGDAVWNSNWYNLDARTLKDVQFILLRCKKPVYFEALPMGITDYPFYFMMIKTGYSYFALFHQSL